MSDQKQSSQLSSPSSDQSSSPSSDQLSPENVLKKLEQEYRTEHETLIKLRREYEQLKDKIMAQQDLVFGKFQVFTNTREQYLIGVIQQQQSGQQKSKSDTSPEKKTNVKKSHSVKSRENNVDDESD